MKLSRNVKPISYLKSHTAEVLRTITSNKEPVLITHHGEVKLVIQDISEYEAEQESLALLKILALGEESRKKGKSKPVKKVFANLRKRAQRRDDT